MIKKNRLNNGVSVSNGEQMKKGKKCRRGNRTQGTGVELSMVWEEKNCNARKRVMITLKGGWLNKQRK